MQAAPEATTDVAPTVEAPASAPSSRAATWVGLLTALGTIALLIPGSGRGWDMDSGLTVRIFVATRSIGDAFTKTYLMTNQVFFSFLDHLVYSATGSRDETVLRLLPIMFTALAVGLLAWELARRFGVGPAVAGAAVLATNPLFALEGSSVRGYSLVVVCAIVTTMLFVRASESDDMSLAAKVGYAVVGAVGVATHLYMIVVLAIHAVMSLCSRRQFERMALPILAALLGIAAYISIAHPMWTVVQVAGRSFQPTFPRDLAGDLLGGTVVAALLTLIVVVPVAWKARSVRVLQLGAGAVVVAVAFAWLWHARTSGVMWSDRRISCWAWEPMPARCLSR
jgi:hypothetical protein